MRALHGFARLALVLGLALAIHPATAHGDSLSLRYIPSYTFSTASRTPAGGATETTETQLFPQRFVLSLDKTLYPALTWSANGLLDWDKSWSQDAAARWTNRDTRRWAGNTRLELGTPSIRSSLGYTREQTDARIRQSAVETRRKGPIGENYFLSINWRPADLPVATLALSRQEIHDSARTQIDRATDSANLALSYDGFRRWQLHYAYSFTKPVDRLRDAETVSHGHAARVGFADQHLAGRLTTFASYRVATLSSRTTSGSLGAVRETQRPPSAGLSRIEAFPDTPTRVTLQPNAALVDAVLTGGAGIDLGHGRSSAGDTAFRDLGAQFPDDRLDLNRIYVWVDRPLADAVVQAFTWEAYVSEDNVTWARIPIVGTPAFGVLVNRFEIAIERTRARYLKMVTRPLAAGVTVDPVYAEILVTELQFSLVEPLPPGVSRSRDLSGALTGGLRYLMLRERNLSYDAAFTLAHHDPPFQARESLQQSLGYTRRLDEDKHFSARAARTDSIDKSRHSSANTWGATFNAEPLPTLGWNVNYGGGYASSEEGSQLTNGISVAGRADLYEGVSANASAGYTYGDTRGRQSQAATAASGLTVTPHRALTATGTFAWAYTDSWGTGAAQRSRSGRVEGSVAINPFPALYLAGAASRNLFGLAPATQTSVTAGLSLFHGGGLSLRFNAGQTNETLSRTRGRTLGAGLVYTIMQGRSLSVSYSHVETRSPVERGVIDSVFASLQLPAF